MRDDFGLTQTLAEVRRAKMQANGAKRSNEEQEAYLATKRCFMRALGYLE
jgi:hypothetical protein